MSFYRVSLFLAAFIAVGGCNRTPCTPEGDVFDGHELHAGCCEGTSRFSLMVVPSDTYPGTDLPEGCGIDGETPESIMICLDCGDGVCDEGEHFCNCPEDCPRE